MGNRASNKVESNYSGIKCHNKISSGKLANELKEGCVIFAHCFFSQTKGLYCNRRTVRKLLFKTILKNETSHAVGAKMSGLKGKIISFPLEPKPTLTMPFIIHVRCVKPTIFHVDIVLRNTKALFLWQPFIKDSTFCTKMIEQASKRTSLNSIKLSSHLTADLRIEGERVSLEDNSRALFNKYPKGKQTKRALPSPVVYDIKGDLKSTTREKVALEREVERIVQLPKIKFSRKDIMKNKSRE
ncbi:hypothetical protein A0J61_11195 [Choanephora cucurbitarum]|uniref:Uncharacterized protein n=1 Tax=Choanephora cucurbitarum TaxID=101091 RepID=A0A1C7MWC1_9FUNG|nr:hypothetical protein A0J61_11195 [Choanephora cucurbitarum]